MQRLFFINEDVYYGTEPGERFSKLLAPYKELKSSFGEFTSWAKITYAPVKRDLSVFFSPSARFSQAIAGNATEISSETILILLKDVDIMSQCHTLYEGVWLPMESMMDSIDSDKLLIRHNAELGTAGAEVTSASKAAYIADIEERRQVCSPTATMRRDSTWRIVFFARICHGKGSILLSITRTLMRSTRLEAYERRRMEQEENLSRRHNTNLANFAKDHAETIASMKAEKDSTAKSRERLQQGRVLRNRRALPWKACVPAVHLLASGI